MGEKKILLLSILSIICFSSFISVWLFYLISTVLPAAAGLDILPGL